MRTTNQLTQEECKELFIYDNGILRWKTYRASNKIKPNDKAGSLRKDGYSDISVNGKKHLTHVLVWNYHNGKYDSSKFQLDHITQIGEGGTNAITNLRLSTVAHNNQNRVAKSKSGYTNICHREDCLTKPWRVGISISNHKISEYFGSLEEAIKFRDEKRKSLGMVPAKDKGRI